jgi:hypothetical protein
MQSPLKIKRNKKNRYGKKNTCLIYPVIAQEKTVKTPFIVHGSLNREKRVNHALLSMWIRRQNSMGQKIDVKHGKGYRTVYYNQQANGIVNPEELKGWLKNDA